MADRVEFIIDNKKFTLDLRLIGKDRFTIKSAPFPYQVIWEDDKSPTETICDLLIKQQNSFLLIDQTIFRLYGKGIKFPKEKMLIVKPSEEFKTLEGVKEGIDFLEKNKFTKGDKLIVAGGGIIQDVGAFVGACFKRGIHWMLIPTTLLSISDSCIGAKTGINYQNAKNQLGLFSAPKQVIINPMFLKTLREKEIKSGLGEILKLHITGGKKMLKDYDNLVKKGKVDDFGSYKQLILGSLRVKKTIIEEDEFEQNLRKSLNYGHTIGHAIEVLSGYLIPHGQAIATGMIIANELSRKRGMLSDAETSYLRALLNDLIDKNLLSSLKNISLDKLGDLLHKDKKTMGNQINFVILKKIGKMGFLPLKLDISLLKEINEIIRKI